MGGIREKEGKKKMMKLYYNLNNENKSKSKYKANFN